VSYFYPQDSRFFEFPTQHPFQKTSYKIHGKILNVGDLDSTIIVAKIKYKYNGKTLEVFGNKEFIQLKENQQVEFKEPKQEI
jgi:hypothetical protein